MIQVLRLAVLAVLALPVAAAAEPEMSFKMGSARSTPAAEFQAQMKDARAKVRAWWGATFEDAIHVIVEDKKGPSMALVPAWRGERGRMFFTAGTVDQGRVATHHEMVHVYAPNANRFLAEGLATYAHDLLGGKPAYPNFGRALDPLAAKHASLALMQKLERASTPTPLEPIDENGYVLAGSFVKFLIERHGMEKFRALYAKTPLVTMKREPGPEGRWSEVYGQDFAALVGAWMAELKK